MNYPKVTVLMSVYNGERYLKEAIDSILNQTFTDFEFIIINDASTDSSRKIISEYNDSRIRLIDNETNMGLTQSLNKGLDLAKGEYIARMDCDDISLPNRLEEQVAYMEDHPGVIACGTWVKVIGEVEGSVWEYPTDPDIIKSRLLFESTIAHPSVIINRKLLNSENLRYNPKWFRAQDYELWYRCSKLFLLTNIDKVLMMYRIHSQQIGRDKSTEQKDFANLVRQMQLHDLGIISSETDMDLHYLISTWQFKPKQEFIKSADTWLCKLHEANSRSMIYPEPAFSRILAERWFEICSKACGLGTWVWKAFWSSPLSRWVELNSSQKYKFYIKSLIKRVN